MKVDFFDKNRIDHEAASLIIEKINIIIKKKGSAVIALSGGKSPQKLYELLGQSLEKNNIQIILVDERVVQEEDERSNASFLKRCLGALSECVNSYPILEKDYLLRSNKLLDNFGTIDLAVLGMGNDGHTASLFSENDTLEKGRVVEVQKTGEDIKRISLSFEELLNVDQIIFFIKGEDKKEMVETVLNGEHGAQYPSGKVMRAHNNIIVLSQEWR